MSILWEEIMKKWVITFILLSVFVAVISLVIGRTKATAVPANAKYVSEKRCYMCHRSLVKQHENAKHSKSFKSLLDNNQDKNPKCLPCHTTGYGKPGGFVDANSTPDLIGVGCQACHGPGSDHTENGLSKEQRKQKINVIGSGECVKCHKIHEKHIDIKSK
jgi:hypothetical protein